MKLFRMVDVIEKKRNGEVLTKEEITFFVNGYTDWLDSGLSSECIPYGNLF